MLVAVLQGALTSTSAAQRTVTSQSMPNYVFVFTLDCNDRIYCYDTEDDAFDSRLADKPSSLKCPLLRHKALTH